MNDPKTFVIQILEKEKEKENYINPHFDLLWDFFLGKTIVISKPHYFQYTKNKKYPKESPMVLTTINMF